MRRAVEALTDRMSDLCDERGWDWGCSIEGGMEYAWSCSVRVTQEPNRADGAPDRSVVFYATGGNSADDVVERAIRAALTEFDVEAAGGLPPNDVDNRPAND